MNSRSFGCEVLEAVEIGPPGFIQGYHFAVDKGVGGKIVERLSDLRESFVEVLMVPGEQDCFATGLDSDSAVAIQLNFLCDAECYVALT